MNNDYFISELRNTPTGVGKTLPAKPAYHGAGKHPHGRGEDPAPRQEPATSLETPPRAWGRLQALAFHVPTSRNTPTGVGKTITATSRMSTAKKHPHGRGEDTARRHGDDNRRETPPRAWGRPHLPRLGHNSFRNTPTGVGKTLQPAGPRCIAQKHPHGRGEDSVK